MSLNRAGSRLSRSLSRLESLVVHQQNTPYGTLLPVKLKCEARTESGQALASNFSALRYNRSFHTGLASLGNIDVKVQSMGESITEGSIAEILKQEGESVKEDETILQIETDKVTIDVKAPKAGKLAQLKVKQDDTVEVGQLVAVVSEGDSGEGSEEKPSTSASDQQHKPQKNSKKQKKEPKKQQADKKEESPEGGREEKHDAAHAHKPSLRFPPRMTSDGQRISELPAAEQQQHLRSGGSGNEGSKPIAEEKSGQAESTKPPPQPPKSFITWYAGTEQGTKLSQSSVLSDFEMEQIELGGAEP